MTARYSDGEDAIPEAATAALMALAGRAQAVAIGPGIPTGAGMRRWSRRWRRGFRCRW